MSNTLRAAAVAALVVVLSAVGVVYRTVERAKKIVCWPPGCRPTRPPAAGFSK
jgi:hypothetical protein